MQVASETGDARRALELLRRATEIAELEQQRAGPAATGSKFLVMVRSAGLPLAACILALAKGLYRACPHHAPACVACP
jgi:hypothetical protein